MRQQDPYADIALPIQTGDPYADIAAPIPTNRNRRQAPAAAPQPQEDENAPFQPELLPGDNGIYPTMRPNAVPAAPPVHEIDPDQATANAAVFGAQGTQRDPINLATLPPEDRAYLNGGWYVKLPNGEVRRLMADARPNAGGEGAEQIAPGLFLEAQSTIPEDMAKSLPTGVVEGLTGTLGAQGTLGQMIGLRQGDYLPGLGVIGPSGEQINESIRNHIGYDYYQPQTPLGEWSRTVGEFAPGALVPGSTGTKLASWLVPAGASEGAGQLARMLQGGERDTAAEGYARMAGGFFGGLGVGGVNTVRGGADISLRNAAQGVTPQQLEMAALLRRDADSFGINLTNANAVQQVTGGGTGLGQLQRAVEGSSPRLQSYFAALPEQVRGAVGAQLDQIGPSVEPSALAPRVQQAAGGVLDTLRRRANEDAGQFYDRLPGQSLPPEQFGQLTENPSFAAALRAVRDDEELAPLLNRAPPMEQDVRMLRAQQQGFGLETYHGTATRDGTAFDSFDPARLGSNTRQSEGELGFFSSARPDLANEYATIASRGGWRPDRVPADPYVMPLRVRAQNPRRYDTASEFYNDAYAYRDDLSGWRNRLQSEGYDSVIVRPDAEEVVAFSPDQIRSSFDPFAAPTPDNDLNVINEVVKQLDTMADEAAPNSMRVGGSMTRASQRREARALADALASEASPDWRMAHDTVRGVNEAFIDPLKAGPIGALADANEAAPNLAGMTGRLFPDKPFEGQAQETARALELMGEIDPTVGGPLVRQHLSRQAMESMQDTPSGPNQFGGADFAARVFGNPEQRRTVMGALDVVNRPDPNMAFPPLSANAAPARGSDPMANLVEVLMATGQRHKGGSQTAFIQELQQQMRNGNLATGAAQTITNPTGVFGRVGRGIDDWTARRNAETLADLLMANSEEFNARLTRAINRPRGANRVRAGVALSAGQED